MTLTLEQGTTVSISRRVRPRRSGWLGLVVSRQTDANVSSCETALAIRQTDTILASRIEKKSREMRVKLRVRTLSILQNYSE